MADYGQSDTSTTSLGANQFPISEVYVPNAALTALEGGPVSTDGGGKKSAPASMYIKDGGNVTQGLSSDANTINSIMGRLTKIRDLLLATLTVGGTITEANSAAILADLAAIATQTSGLATQTTLAAVLAKLVTSPALEGGHLATIDTNTASAKTDLDTIATNTTGVATAANQAAGNTSLSSIATNTTGLATQATLAAAKTDLDIVVTNTNKIPASPATEGGHLAAIDTSTAAAKTDLDAIAAASIAGMLQQNTAQVAGTATSVNAGNRGAGTQRMIEAANPTPTVTQVASAASDCPLLAANANKKGTLFFNDSTAILYLLYGTGAATLINYSVQIPPKGLFEDPLHYTGGFHGLWASANGFVYCTEVS